MKLVYLKISWKSFCGVFNMRERMKGGSKLGAVYDLVFERRLWWKLVNGKETQSVRFCNYELFVDLSIKQWNCLRVSMAVLFKSWIIVLGLVIDVQEHKSSCSV